MIHAREIALRLRNIYPLIPYSSAQDIDVIAGIN